MRGIARMPFDPRYWLTRTAAEAYHGDKPPHPFDECGDPFCSEAYDRASALADVVEAAQAVIDLPAHDDAYSTSDRRRIWTEALRLRLQLLDQL